MTSTRIYFCGEVVMDLLETQQESGMFQSLLGGSQFHSAMGAMKAVQQDGTGFKIGFVGPLSSDMFGERFFAAMEKQGVDTSCIKRVDRNTTLAIVSIRPGHENGFTFYGRDTAEQMTKIEDLPVSLGEKGDKTICCFGSISTVMEPARFAWLEFAKRQRELSLTFYDLNTRPKIAGNPERYRGIVAEWARTAHVVKASDADLEWAYPGKSMAEVAQIWLNEGAHMAVFTKGKSGSEAYTKKVKAQAEATVLDGVTNTVGAGDNFNGGFAMSLAKKGIFSPQQLIDITENDLHEVLAGANHNSAVHLMRQGARERIAPLKAAP